MSWLMEANSVTADLYVFESQIRCLPEEPGPISSPAFPVWSIIFHLAPPTKVGAALTHFDTALTHFSQPFYLCSEIPHFCSKEGISARKNIPPCIWNKKES